MWEKGKLNELGLKKNRNDHWVNTVKKHNYYVEIWNYFESEYDAFENEKELILMMFDVMPLTNKTNGGEGVSGRKVTLEEKEKMRIRSIGESNPHFGKKHSPENLILMKKIKQGNLNPMFGKRGENNPCAKALIVVYKNGETHLFKTTKEAATFTGLDYGDMAKYKTGLRKIPEKYNIKEIKPC